MPGYQYFAVFICSCIFATFTKANNHEPSCSKFHYEEKLLEKMVRMEYKMEALEDRLKELETTGKTQLDTDAKRDALVEDKLVAIETNMLEQTQHIANETSARISAVKDLQENFKNQLQILKESSKQKTIAFMAQLSTDVENPNSGDRLVFDDVITNEGSAYDRQQGLFTAPQSGVYNFNLIVSAQNKPQRHALHLHIMKNGSKTDYIFLDHNHSYWFRRSTDITIKLSSGDRVWVKVGYVDGSNLLGGGSFHNLFSGFLIGAL